MTLPASYNEAGIAQYMSDVLGELTDVLGLSVAGSDFDESVNNVLVALGTETPETLTSLADKAKIRALALVEAWRLVVTVTAGEYDFSADGGRYNRSQINEMARKNLAAAINEATRYDPDYQIRIGTISNIHDPYIYLPDDQRIP